MTLMTMAMLTMTWTTGSTSEKASETKYDCPLVLLVVNMMTIMIMIKVMVIICIIKHHEDQFRIILNSCVCQGKIYVQCPHCGACLSTTS